ncbi:DUF3455 domain-containing protein [Tunturiibacter gelidoferens]|uniref:DUF3455 domain-containing protein n=1 Tax=Tunturiibacter lichenicola TaxID=2051959 RepID=A0A7Y9NJU2_9BACT|nr:DUF3455 domain-containing protein [Edaphobacter lichenicola]NYF50644.1 hypothetical protein [Edaphobacter lichenicola]
MKLRTSLRLSVSATVIFAAFSSAQSPTDLSITVPPPPQRPILTVAGKGVQVYACQQTDTGPQWIFKAPEATLTDESGLTVGTHSAGPIWISKDGSSTKGELLQKSPSPEPGAIPWLLLKAASPTGSGIMTHVEFIRRSDTHGGIAPTTGCDAQHLTATTRVPYTATYTFYSAKP